MISLVVFRRKPSATTIDIFYAETGAILKAPINLRKKIFVRCQYRGTALKGFSNVLSGDCEKQPVMFSDKNRDR